MTRDAAPHLPDRPEPALTRNQALVLATLEAAATPLGAYAVLDRLRDDGLKAPAQIYRALSALQDKGLVHRLECLNAFVACRHVHDPAEDGAPPGPAVFVICDHCSATRELTDPVIGGQIERLARNQGFGLHTSSIEVRGLCAACSRATQNDPGTT
ncbi:transcriptional repressor [Roseospira marina]|uniref:Transcriptional repressor n=1 Tax=Roseospira marina TaxID=140057 RepID=A0A5M6IFU4_9PROT|nr:Fur family transcriptional regulator [Roseospira marina]KAA5607002.1 transcriptional repressor [Roseospira marina]MBB4312816.1 Fur family zinc uptake transcriptional regulator [Roseospira marina]MBB5086411.1 Fur family zinc uptake transcriptional regulator [Roseospira marina]